MKVDEWRKKSNNNRMELENEFVLIVFPSALGSVSLAFLEGSFCQESL